MGGYRTFSVAATIIGAVSLVGGSPGVAEDAASPASPVPLASAPQDAYISVPPQSFVMESVIFGEERKQDGSVTPIFERSHSEMVTLAQDTPASPRRALRPAAPAGDASTVRLAQDTPPSPRPAAPAGDASTVRLAQDTPPSPRPAALAGNASTVKLAQDTPSPRRTPRPAQPGNAAPAMSDTDRVNQLQQQINQRDTLILDLLQRVERLENERSGSTTAAPIPPVTPAAVPASATPPPSDAEEATSATRLTPQPPAPRQTPAVPQQPAAAAPSGPGQFAVSEEDAQRALERALVQSGAAVLQAGTLEVVPSLTYTFRRDAFPSQIALATNGTVFITETVSKATALEANALVRVGLPWQMQAEVALPWSYKNVSVTTRATGAGLGEHTVEAQGFGDPAVSLTKQVLVEGDVRPGLYAGVNWNSNFGQVKNSVPLGTGFNEIGVGLTAVKRQDPLVFTAGFNYQHTFESNRYEPAGQYTPSVGILLAVSPETSLRFSQQLTFAGTDKFNGAPIPGTGKTIGIFSFGLLSILGRGLVLNVTGGVGETHDAPDLFMQVALPIRLN